MASSCQQTPLRARAATALRSSRRTEVLIIGGSARKCRELFYTLFKVHGKWRRERPGPNVVDTLFNPGDRRTRRNVVEEAQTSSDNGLVET